MDSIKQNLLDAGCDKAGTAEICRLYESGDTKAVILRLRRHRRGLMDTLHESQDRVDCLDFLLHKLEKSQVRHV